MKTFILVLPIETFDRKHAERIENQTYETFKEVPLDEGWSMYELSDFMDLVNNEEFNDLENWITYIHIKN